MLTADKIALLVLIVSFGTLLFSFFSYKYNIKLAKDGFNRSFRPYLFISNLSHVQNKISIPQMNAFRIIIINAPALITKQMVDFYERKDGKDVFLFSHPYEKQSAIFPFSDFRYDVTTNFKQLNPEVAINLSPNKLIRKVYIEYTWISKEKETYYFSSESEYNIQSKSWDNLRQSAN